MQHHPIGTMSVNKFDSLATPNFEELLNYKYWTIFEASLILTEWSDKHIEKTHCKFSQTEALEFFSDRSYLIMPEEPFRLDNYSEKVEKTFKELLIDIYFELVFTAKYFKLSEGINHVIRPLRVIMWAIDKGMILPLDLQKALKIEQMQQKKRTSWKEKVKVKIVGSYYLQENKNAHQTEVIRCPWMKKYAPESIKITERHLLRDIKDISRREPELIPEVLQRNGLQFKCDFKLLNEAITTAAKLVSKEKIGVEKVWNTHINEFTKLLKEDQIISLYLFDVPEIIRSSIETSIKRVYCEICSRTMLMNGRKVTGVVNIQ